MSTERARWITIVAVLALTTSAVELCGQTMYGQPNSLYPPQSASGFPSAPGNWASAPAGYLPGWPQPAPAGYYMPPAGAVNAMQASFQQPEPPVSPPSPEPPDPEDADTLEELWDQQENSEDYYWYGRHGGRLSGGLMRLLALLAPYSEGGCCAPRWFDVHVEVLNLWRDGDEQDWVFTTLGQPSAGGIPVLTSNDIDLDDGVGVRITGTHQTGPGSNLEFTYLGANNYNRAGSTSDAADGLFSIYDNFGQAPSAEITQLHQAEFQSIGLESKFDSLELNFRRRWNGPTCLFQGSWLVGVRYFELIETFDLFSSASRDTNGDGVDDTGGTFDEQLRTRNYMTGAQLGGDLWVCVMPGLRVGVDGKFGLYGNNAKAGSIRHTIDQFTGLDTIDVEASGNDKVSFVGEVGFLTTYQLNHRLTLRAGYQVVFVEGVALAADNFNPVDVGRTPFLDDGGSLFYKGFTAGLEWMW